MTEQVEREHLLIKTALEAASAACTAWRERRCRGCNDGAAVRGAPRDVLRLGGRGRAGRVRHWAGVRAGGCHAGCAVDRRGAVGWAGPAGCVPDGDAPAGRAVAGARRPPARYEAGAGRCGDGRAPEVRCGRERARGHGARRPARSAG
jgi:hypothetical protein